MNKTINEANGSRIPRARYAIDEVMRPLMIQFCQRYADPLVV